MVNRKPVEIPEALPCPCCGEGREWPVQEVDEQGRNPGIRVGVTGSMKGGVECKTCGLNLSRSFPDEFPRGIKDIDQLYAYVTKQAVEAWNKRTST